MIEDTLIIVPEQPNPTVILEKLSKDNTKISSLWQYLIKKSKGNGIIFSIMDSSPTVNKKSGTQVDFVNELQKDLNKEVVIRLGQDFNAEIQLNNMTIFHAKRGTQITLPLNAAKKIAEEISCIVEEMVKKLNDSLKAQTSAQEEEEESFSNPMSTDLLDYVPFFYLQLAVGSIPNETKTVIEKHFGTNKKAQFTIKLKDILNAIKQEVDVEQERCVKEKHNEVEIFKNELKSKFASAESQTLVLLKAKEKELYDSEEELKKQDKTIKDLNKLIGENGKMITDLNYKISELTQKNTQLTRERETRVLDTEDRISEIHKGVVVITDHFDQIKPTLETLLRECNNWEKFNEQFTKGPQKSSSPSLESKQAVPDKGASSSESSEGPLSRSGEKRKAEKLHSAKPQPNSKNLKTPETDEHAKKKQRASEKV